MLDRLRQYEGEDQVALFGAPSQSLFAKIFAQLHRAILAYRAKLRA